MTDAEETVKVVDTEVSPSPAEPSSQVLTNAQNSSENLEASRTEMRKQNQLYEHTATHSIAAMFKLNKSSQEASPLTERKLVERKQRSKEVRVPREGPIDLNAEDCALTTKEFYPFRD